MRLKPRMRKGERGGGFIVMLQRYAQTIVTVALAGGVIWGGLTHFAAASDVEKKFSQIQYTILKTGTEMRKERIEDELFRLRQERASASRDAQIQRHEAQLNDLNSRLRDIEREQRK